MAVVDDVAALKKFGAKIRQNEQGEVVLGVLHNTKITDPGLVHLKGLAKLQTLSVSGGIMRRSGITDASLVHLKGLVGLETLYFIMT